MNNFFRKIRLNLLSEGKTGKYLKYAIGEILLVIIGILIALQINNWNDKRIERNELNLSLHSMIEELNQNIKFLETEKKDKQERLLTIESFKDVAGSDQDPRNIVFAIGDEVKSKEFNTVYQTLKDEKKIRLIQSSELRDQITTFYEYELAGITDFNTWHDKFVSEIIDPYFLENIPLSNNIEIDPNVINEFINQSKFKNILASQETIYMSYVSLNEKVTQLAKDLKSTLSSLSNK
ncbi:DUF6090 family protein [Constantimarinum furrinae]|uniref:Uncharacterized protein n=1 Tax=Constantimarinum furrinae TaxID=2562285 RepID=A0A7G8PUW2_9FLAO|nr:DUF6090 family protein [Constantimarinum furrinae]QNJ98128.1 hypothetical protein ALE3EI_1570 [Constantimarinum furrinae]